MSAFTSDVVIGLEVHAELNTKTKLFCSCARTGSEEPNTRTCPTCLGMPGAKPVLNKKAVDYAIKLALATKSQIAPQLVFSRKSYFYPDLASNYQITQYELPLCQKGTITLGSGKPVRLKRIHLEEDPAALVHTGSMHTSPFVLVDYNRSGNPLVEIVTEPDLASAGEARDFMNQLITILGYLEIFDIDHCIIKADANVSIKGSGYIRAEIKNITGFKDIERALLYEISRQKKSVAEGHTLKQETRSWDTEQGVTHLLRTKETDDDYGYIIEPNLPVVELDQKWIADVQKTVPELAQDKARKFAEHGVEEDTAKIISKDRDIAELFEQVAANVDPELASNWVRRELTKVLNYQKKTLKESGITSHHMIDLLSMIASGKITPRVGQKILEKLSEEAFDVIAHVKKEGLEAVQDANAIDAACKEAIAEAPQAVEEFRKGIEKSFHYLVGLVMKKTQGKARPDQVKEALEKLIK